MSTFMANITWMAKLKELGLTKKQLSKELGVSPEQVTRWGEDPPRYAVAYVNLMREVRALRLCVNSVDQACRQYNDKMEDRVMEYLIDRETRV